MGHDIPEISWNFKRSIPDIESHGIVYIFLSKSWNIREFVRELHSVLRRCVLCKQNAQTAASPELSFSQHLSCA